MVEGIADIGWADTFAEARGEVEAIWADDTLLDRMVTLPWATLPGRPGTRRVHRVRPTRIPR